MVEDASLDDFLDADSESEDDAVGADTTGGADGQAANSPGADGGADDAGTESTDTVEPAVTTYAWSPDGAACAACGAVVERRWIHEGQLVCGACKSW